MTQAASRAGVLGWSRHVGRGPVDARGVGRRGGRVRGRRRPAEAGRDGTRSASARVAAGAVEVEVDRRARRVRRATSSCPRCTPTRCTRASTRSVSALSRPVIVEHLVASARRAPRRRGRPRLHGKGNDQVRFEVSSRILAPDLDVLAPVRVWGLTRADCIELAAQVGDPDRGDRGEALLDRREHVGPRDRVRRAREPVGRAARGAVHADRATPRTRPREPREIVVGVRARRAGRARRRADRRSSTLIDELGTSGRRYGWGRIDMVENRRVGIKSREVYECPASLALDARAPGPRGHHARARRRAREAAARDPRRRADLRRPVALAADAGARSVRRRDAARRHRRGAAAARAGPVLRRGPAGPTRAVRPRPRDLRRRGRVPPRGLGGLRAAVGPLGRDVVAPARAREPRPTTSSDDDDRASRCGTAASAKARPTSCSRSRVSLPFDRRLATDDLMGSRAHVAMLAHVGLLTDEERSVDPRRARPRRAWSWTKARSRSRRPTRTSTPRSSGGSPRSRADRRQAAHRPQPQRPGRARPAAVRAARGPRRRSRASTRCRRCCCARAERRRPRSRCPGYTHLQRAQPVLLAHHLLAHFWALGTRRRPLARLLERADVSPLGAGRARRLEPAARSRRSSPPSSASRRRFENSLDAVSDRDFVAEALFVATLTQLHLSRIGEEIVLWSTEEFGFVRLADAYATGSSMLPQKKNPDIAELARGKAGRLIGDLTGLLATLKGLPLAYNRDLQEDKEPLFDALDTCALSLAALAGLHRDRRVRRRTDDARRPTARSNAATDLAEHLVEQGTPFREAHTLVGGARAAGGRTRRPARRARRERSAPRPRRAAAARAGQRGAAAHDAGRRRPGTGRRVSCDARRSDLARRSDSDATGSSGA